MNKLMTLLILLIGGTAMAQNSDDTTRFTMGGVEFIIIDHDTMAVNHDDPDNWDNEDWTEDSDDLTYWSGFHVGINMLMNQDFKPEFDDSHLQIDPALSFSYSFNLMEHRIRIAKDYFGIVTGIGFTNSRYGFSDNYLTLGSTADSTFGWTDSSITNGYTKNQLRVNYFNIPLLFQINTSKNEDKNFHLSFGAIGGVRIGSKVKYKYDVFGGENTDKVKGRFNLNPFTVQGTVRLGFRDFGLFANYDVLSLYEKGKSTAAYPLTFGASFHF